MPAQNVWLGTASAVAQVDLLTPGGTIEAGDVFNVVLTAEDGSTTQTLSVSATTTTITGTVDDIVAAFNASLLSLFTAITASRTGSNNSSQVVLTADTAGVPFYCTVSTAEASGVADDQTFVRAASTASRGPSDWNTAANWMTGAVPVTGDSVTIDGRSEADILYGLDQDGVTLAALTIGHGLANQVGTLTYPLRISATACTIGEAAADGSVGSGSQLVNLNFGTAQNTTRVIQTNAMGTSGYPPVQIVGTHASNAITIEDGVVGLGTAVPAQAYTYAVNVTGRGARYTLGSGGTVATLNQSKNAGEGVVYCALTTLNLDGGTVRTEGTGAITTANVSGTLVSNSTGTITTLNVQGSGFADFTQTTAARTVTTVNIIGTQARADFDNGASRSITWTNPLQTKGGARADQVKLWTDIGIQHSAGA